ncbi:hypothetical protein QM012_001782 [Aureobasidium pullulans]|uniref:C2H2-type domain-containing protein n=1 Tax=Aureobasidium pullulans TaxID=5580 RepID=A0ABR0TCL4_AURPU
MPCRDKTHEHDWPTEGLLHIRRCEIFCGYCDGEDAKVVHNYPWHLRDHIRKVHAHAQGLSITVSPQAPKVHTSVKRKHEEMEKSDSDEHEEEEEDEKSEENESSGSEYQEDQNKKGKAKVKTGSQTKPLSDSFAANDAEDASSKPASLRLRAKPAGKPKKSSLEGHAASFKPVGPSSPKHPARPTAMGPPPAVPINNSTGPPPLPYQQLHQRMQDFARAPSAHVIATSLGPAGRPQQIANNGQPNVGNIRPPTSNIGPLNGNMGPPNASMGPSMNSQRAPMPDQSYGRVNPFINQPMIPNHQPGQIPQPHPAIRDFYTSHPQVITPAAGPPNHQRLRNLTTHMLTHSNMSEQSVVNHYQQEIEYIRSLHTTRLMTSLQEQMYGSVVQQVRQQFVQPPLELEVFLFRVVEHALVRHGLIAAPLPSQGTHRPPLGQQQGGQVAGLRQTQQQQMDPQRYGSQQLGGQQPGARQPAAAVAPQPPMAQQVGARDPAQVDQTDVPGQQQQQQQPPQVGGPAEARPQP